MRVQSRWRYVPHALSFLRVVLVGAIYTAALAQDKPLFAVLVLCAILTDILDGPIARHLGTAGRFGANVDSAADLIFYLSLPVWTWLFDDSRQVVIDHRYEIAIFGVLYLAVNVLSHMKFGALGVHNRLSRTSGTVGVVGTFYTILWGLNAVVYILIIGVLAADLAQRYGALARANFGKPQSIIR